jgi:hypothetical protein
LVATLGQISFHFWRLGDRGDRYFLEDVMSRSGYVDDWDCDDWQAALCRGSVVRAFKGKRGQAFLKEMLATLDAMPEKRLIANDLETEDGAVCAIGSVGKARGVDMKPLDPEDAEGVAAVFGIAPSMVREIVYMNDEGGWQHDETPEARFDRVRKWIASEIRPDKPSPQATVAGGE